MYGPITPFNLSDFTPTKLLEDCDGPLLIRKNKCLKLDPLHTGLDEKKKKRYLLHCSTNPVNVEEELRWSVALLTSKSGSCVTGSLSISPENRNIWLLGTRLRLLLGHQSFKKIQCYMDLFLWTPVVVWRLVSGVSLSVYCFIYIGVHLLICEIQFGAV